ncbi:hypothetical protein [Streptomyces sp. LUP47B]|uniref:hypothetical protein n=1 Tax=Streptomyces sp. LUP47B TaxID=1890286 RepID=UPI000ABCF0AB|nr:hypothetical protein [Streptomyces sp. LUP47B]
MITAADLPAILRTRPPTPELAIGLARHPDQIDDAIGLLCHFPDTELEQVVSAWNPNRYRSNAEQYPPVPPALLDAVLEYALTPLAHLLQNPGPHTGWEISEHPGLSMPHEFGDGASWHILATCPERWRELVDHPTLGTAVQHLLLDHAEAEQDLNRKKAETGSSFLMRGIHDDAQENREPGLSLNDNLLQACLPALCLPEMAGLPKPSITARHRLHRIADRVRSNPRLLDIVAEQLHAAADECVRRGRLLTPPHKPKDDLRYKSVTVAEDLALLSANPTHLAKACALLTTLEQPTVVSRPPSAQLDRITEGTDLLTPVRLLESNYQHRRAETLIALASNPHTPRTAVTDALPMLHPLELSWICHQHDVPDWLRAAAAGLAPADETEAVLRLLTDDELDGHADPGAVLQSWLDAPETDGVWTEGEVHRAVLKSRHHTLQHLRQLPARDVATEPNLALPRLLDLCGNQPERWKALLKALDYGPRDEKITIGQLLDSIKASPTGASSPEGTGR